MSRFGVYVVVALAWFAGASAFAQGSSTSSLAGVVVDTAGGVVPGATIAVKNNSTGNTFETVSNTAGAFSIPVLDPGTYTVTVALDGFKTAVISDVRLLAAGNHDRWERLAEPPEELAGALAHAGLPGPGHDGSQRAVVVERGQHVRSRKLLEQLALAGSQDVTTHATPSGGVQHAES